MAWSDTEIINIAHNHDKGITRLDIELSGPLSYEVLNLKNPERLVIDFSRTRLKARLPLAKSLGPIIGGIRSGQHSDGRLRLAIDLKLPAAAKIILDEIVKNHSYGLSIVLQQELYVVVIDPGHGGKDPGAIGVGGVREKDIVLDISKRLARLVNQQPGMKSILTRESDHYPSLQARVDTARQVEADVFLSIHADAFRGKSVRGASVYSLSESGASSEMAAYLAQRENSADLTGGVSLSEHNQVVAEAMLDMQLDWKIAESDLLGKEMLKQLSKAVKLHNNNIAHAGFMVLKAPAIPSVLIETGYITNSIDARRLKNSSYKQGLAAAMFRAVLLYCYQRPSCPVPKVTLESYEVKTGDSLSRIAENFASDVTTIKNWNGLENSRIKPKQKLIIPTKTR